MKMTFFTKSSISRSNRLFAFSALTIGALLFQSCTKHDDVPVTPVAAISVRNTSPTEDTYNFYLNGQMVNNAGALSFGQGFSYVQVPAGDYEAKFTTGSSTEGVITKTITTEPSKTYSLFLIGKPNGTADDKLDYLLISDVINSTSSDKAFVRFINVSPDAGSLDLADKDGDFSISDKAYKASSEFMEIDPKTYTFQIRDKGTTNVEKEMSSIDIQQGKIYTIIAKGLLNPASGEQAFDGQTIPNN